MINNIKIQDTVLQSGSPILITQLDLLIHQPLLKEYALNGGEDAMQIFLKIISLEPSLENLQEFPGIKELDIIYIVVNDKKQPEIKNIFNNFLGMFIKDFNIDFVSEGQHAVLKLKNKKIKEMPPLTIENLDFLLIKKYIEAIINMGQANEDFNPDSEKAKEIKAKLDRGRAIRNRNKKHTFLFNAISSFAIDQKMSVSDIYDHFTMYQFITQYERMNSRLGYDASLRALFAGAKDVKLPNWQESI